MSTSKDLSKIFKKLSMIYRNPNDSGSLGGMARLALRAKELKITKDKKIIKEYLESERTYTLHKQLHKKFVRNRTIVAGIDSQWQADLADIQTLAEENDGIKYILTVIDVFIKYAWAIPVVVNVVVLAHYSRFYTFTCKMHYSIGNLIALQHR